MANLSDYLGNYINDKGEKVYYYHPTIIGDAYPTPRIDGSPELKDVEILEIHGAMICISTPAFEAGIETQFPNLKKLIVHRSCAEEGHETLTFDDGAFSDCPNLKEVHLYRNICFVNKRGNLQWDMPFKNSKDAIFYYHTGAGASIVESLDELRRWNINYEEVTGESYKDIPFPTYM